MDTFENAYHTPVMLQECITALNIKPDGVYVDCTFGGGGHSRAILKQLGSGGKLIAFDQDADAKKNLPDDERVLFIPQNFRYIQRFLRANGVDKVDGILADLGVSSFQFDEAERGFSIRFDAPMDMRMDRRLKHTAYDVLMSKTEKELHKMFEQYGEVTNSKTLAHAIVQLRQKVSLKTTEGFKQALYDCVKGNPNKYFAQVFQALRIEVNEEMLVLKEMLEQSIPVLASEGRIAVITFHSIEDRIVKQFFKNETFEEEDDNPFVSKKQERQLNIITKKPLLPTSEEIKRNSRSRSAKLRVAEKK
ncbi:MAG: 16S rRNA (cytosine(1402)-N(4))-methyltransferase RsmH [Chitinophagaceae bacterium]|nr:MAG: 16S rRNA (cytosine(1402)-N(4))-methyltransferase RsmH [Chitinophagaceae bacterium]